MVTMPTLFVHASMKPVVNSWRGCQREGQLIAVDSYHSTLEQPRVYQEAFCAQTAAEISILGQGPMNFKNDIK